MIWTVWLRSSRRRRLLGVLGIAGLAAVAVGAFVAGRGSPDLTYPDAEIEPNDLPSQATPLGPGRPQRGVVARRPEGEQPDRDYYRIEFPGTEPRLIRVDVSGVPDVDLRLEIFGADGGLLAAADNSGAGVGELLPNLRLPRRGPYLVAVHAVADALGPEPARYRISAALRLPGSNDESEPNDDEATATRIVAGLPAVAFAGAAADVDCFLVIGPGGGTLSVEATAVPGVDLSLEVRRPREGVLRVVDAAAASQPERFSGVAWPSGAPPPTLCVRRKEVEREAGPRRGEAPSLATPYFVLANLVR